MSLPARPPTSPSLPSRPPPRPPSDYAPSDIGAPEGGPGPNSGRPPRRRGGRGRALPPHQPEWDYDFHRRGGPPPGPPGMYFRDEWDDRDRYGPPPPEWRGRGRSRSLSPEMRDREGRARSPGRSIRSGSRSVSPGGRRGYPLGGGRGGYGPPRGRGGRGSYGGPGMYRDEMDWRERDRWDQIQPRGRGRASPSPPRK